SSNLHTGMPSFFALSARFAEIPEPGKAMTPIGSTSSIWSLRLNGAALACLVQSGLKAICGTLRLRSALAVAALIQNGPLPAVATGAPFGPCIQPLASYPKAPRAFSHERLLRVFLDVFGLTRQCA